MKLGKRIISMQNLVDEGDMPKIDSQGFKRRRTSSMTVMESTDKEKI
jgi:hypothetical protein